MTMPAQVADLQAPADRRTQLQKATAEPVTIGLGGGTYSLRVLTVREAKDWKSRSVGALAQGLGLDVTDTAQLVDAIGRALSSATDLMLDQVISYDMDRVLPTRDEIEEVATEPQVEDAFLAICAVAFPFVRRMQGLISAADWPAIVAAVREVMRQRGIEQARARLAEQGQTPSPSTTS